METPKVLVKIVREEREIVGTNKVKLVVRKESVSELGARTGGTLQLTFTVTGPTSDERNAHEETWAFESSADLGEQLSDVLRQIFQGVQLSTMGFMVGQDRETFCEITPWLRIAWVASAKGVAHGYIRFRREDRFITIKLDAELLNTFRALF